MPLVYDALPTLLTRVQLQWCPGNSTWCCVWCPIFSITYWQNIRDILVYIVGLNTILRWCSILYENVQISIVFHQKTNSQILTQEAHLVGRGSVEGISTSKYASGNSLVAKENTCSGHRSFRDQLLQLVHDSTLPEQWPNVSQEWDTTYLSETLPLRSENRRNAPPGLEIDDCDEGGVKIL